MSRFGVVALCVMLLGLTAQLARAGDGGGDHGKSLYSYGPLHLKKKARRASAGASGFQPFDPECVARGGGSNVLLDCDDHTLPNNEPDIVVDPRDPDHMIASSNDYDSCCDQFYTTFDGGKTWHTGDMSAESPASIGSDPVTAIDPRSGNAIHASLNFEITPAGLTTNGDVVASMSTDGGLSWGKPVVVYRGFGADDAPTQVFNDKEWLTTDTNPQSPYYGRSYLTWTRFLSHSGRYAESPIWMSYSDDGGRTWTKAKEISGSSARSCTFQTTGPAGRCDEDQGSVTAVTPDGTVHVAFINEQHQAAWEPGESCARGSEGCDNQYLVVSSKDGGTTWADPVHVVDMEDSVGRDFPVNADGTGTLTDYQVRVWSVGNIAASPLDGKLYIVFMDNRAGRHDVAHPITDANVYLAWSRDGTHWSAPKAVSRSRTDQWFPWVEVNPVDGSVGVAYNDRSQDGPYNYTLASGGPRSFDYTKVATEGSHPRNSLFFRARAEDCWKCATFHGDYTNLAYGSDGTANLVWTDMRRDIDLGQTSGHTENIFFARR